ncbi:MAG: hypothetical protein E6I86_09185, partial [Chloroflexi bacterium]
MARIAFGIVVAILAVLLIGPTSLEFWTKTAILASLVIACALRFALVRFVSPLEARERQRAGRGRLGWRLPAALAVALLFIGTLPLAADLSTHSPVPAAGLADGTTPTLKLTAGEGPDVASWVSTSAAIALPPPQNSGPTSASALLWILP